MLRELPFSHEALRDADTVYHVERRMARFHDVDAASTVFFPRYFEYASDLTVDYLRARGVDVVDILARRAWAAPLAHVEADYAAPLRFGDRFVLELVGLHAGRSSYAFGLRMRADDPSARLLATMIVVHVCVDGTTFRPTPLPEALRAAMCP